MPFGEGAVLNDGRQVICNWLSRGIYIDGWLIGGPVVRLPDACLDSTGGIWVVAKEQDGLGGYVMDPYYRWWPVLSNTGVKMTVYGARMIIRPDGTGCRIAFTTNGYEWVSIACYFMPGKVSIQMVQAEAGRIADGSGANGMRDWTPAGSPLPMSPLDESLLGYHVRALTTARGVGIACSLDTGLPDQVMLMRDGKLGTLEKPGSDWQSLRLSENGKYWIGCRYAGATIIGGEIPANAPPLDTVMPIVPIGRPVWCGFFNFIPAETPGNCTLDVPTLTLTCGNQAIAKYVAAEQAGTIEALEAAVAAAKGDKPIIAYWPRGMQAGRIPAGADWIGVDAYRLKDESLSSFEHRVRSAIAKCHKVALICQCYTSNSTLTGDLAALVPVYARIARDCSNVVAVLAFSGSGRPSGLQDHPEIRPLWEQLASGIPSVPPIESEEFVEPWRVRVIHYDPVLARGQRSIFRAALGNGIEIEWQKEADDTEHLALYKDGKLQDRSVSARYVDIRC